MDKTVAGVLGVVTALAAASPASAAPVTREAALQADSYKALLAPIPNALALLREDAGAGSGEVERVQYYYPYGYPPPPPVYAPGYYAYPYWHHHHHHWYRPRFYHHHHHHHHWRGW